MAEAHATGAKSTRPDSSIKPRLSLSLSRCRLPRSLSLHLSLSSVALLPCRTVEPQLPTCWRARQYEAPGQGSVAFAHVGRLSRDALRAGGLGKARPPGKAPWRTEGALDVSFPPARLRSVFALLQVVAVQGTFGKFRICRVLVRQAQLPAACARNPDILVDVKGVWAAFH